MGGKAKPAAPDYAGLSRHGMAAQQHMGNLGQQQMDFARQMYDQQMPMYNGMASINMGLQSYNADMGKNMGDMFQNTYMPMMQEQADAARNFNTEAHREGLAQQAAADVARAFSNQQDSSARSMASMGVNPNSGRFAGQQRASDIGLAAARAGAMTGTRRQAEAEGQQRLGAALDQGQGLGGMAYDAFGTSMVAGKSAGDMLQMPGNNYLAGTKTGIGTMGLGYDYGQTGLSGALRGQQAMYDARVDQGNAAWQGIGTMAGMAAGSFLGPMGTAAGSYLGKYAAGKMAG